MKSPLLSPLKQDNLGQLRPRPLLTTRYEALFQPNLPPQPPSSFHDLFCLDPDPHELVARLEQLSLQDLLGSYRVSTIHPPTPLTPSPPQSSIADLFTNAVRLLRSDDDVVQRNVVEVSSVNLATPYLLTGHAQTLITLLRNVLTREYSAYSLQVSMILVGSMDARSDAVFTVRAPPCSLSPLTLYDRTSSLLSISSSPTPPFRVRLSTLASKTR